MARQERILSVRGAMAIAKPGRHSDGGGLYLYLSRDGRRSWVYLFAWQGRQCEMGLGSFPLTTLAEARDARDKWRKVLRDGANPIEVRRSGTGRAGQTFGACAAGLIEAKRSAWRSELHARQWLALETQAAMLWDRAVDSITVTDVLAVLKSLSKTPETASRVRGRIESVLDAAKAQGLRSGENPAAWKGNLAHLLPKRAKSRDHHAAMDYADVPTFVARLRSLESVAARALEFVILTAGRRSEVRFARWPEIDIDAKVWTVPADRMKMGQVHRVPLCARAVAIIEERAAYRCNSFSPAGPHNRAIGENAMSRLCPDGATVHGFRSSFRDWCGNETSFSREIAEAALAHATGNAVEAAYRRSDALQKRRALMEEWASYCEPDAGGNVIPIRTTL